MGTKAPDWRVGAICSQQCSLGARRNPRGTCDRCVRPASQCLHLRNGRWQWAGLLTGYRTPVARWITQSESGVFARRKLPPWLGRWQSKPLRRVQTRLRLPRSSLRHPPWTAAILSVWENGAARETARTRQLLSCSSIPWAPNCSNQENDSRDRTLWGHQWRSIWLGGTCLHPNTLTWSSPTADLLECECISSGVGAMARGTVPLRHSRMWARPFRRLRRCDCLRAPADKHKSVEMRWFLDVKDDYRTNKQRPGVSPLGRPPQRERARERPAAYWIRSPSWRYRWPSWACNCARAPRPRRALRALCRPDLEGRWAML